MARCIIALGLIGLLFFAVPALRAQLPDSATLSGPALLNTYSELTGRSVLSAPVNVTITNFPSDRQAAIAFIESEMEKQGIDVIPEGFKFVRLQPKSWRGNAADNYLKAIPQPATNHASIPAGMINLMGVDLWQCLATYSAIRSRTVLRSLSLPTIQPVFFRNATQLSNDELVFAFTVILALNGIAPVDDGQKFVWVVPISELGRVQAGAAKLDSKSKLIARERIPVFTYSATRPRATTLDQLVKETAVDLYKKLTGPVQPPVLPPNVGAAFEFYGNLVDKQTVMGVSTNQFLYFKAQTSLTKAELAYAIETTLKLNNIAIVSVDKTTIRTVPLGEALQMKTNNALPKADLPIVPRKRQ